MTTWTSLRESLATQLRALYDESSYTSAEAVARDLGQGWSQPKVSRAFTPQGRLTPRPEDVRALAQILGADPDAAEELSGIAQRIRDERSKSTPSRTVLDRHGSPAKQAEIARIEARSQHVTGYHPVLVHGLLQIETYMRAIVAAVAEGWDEADVVRWVESRLARQEGMADRSCTLIVPETVFWQSGMLTGPEMADQVEHVAGLIDTRSRWDVRVIPRGAPPDGRPIYVPNGVDLYDDRLLMIGLTAGTITVTEEDAGEIAKHRGYLDRLLLLACGGPSPSEKQDAVELLLQTAAELRGHPPR